MKYLLSILLLIPFVVRGQIISLDGISSIWVKNTINDSLNNLRDSAVVDIVRIGGKVNYVTIDSVNGMRMYGNTTVWEDVPSGGNALGTGAAAPALRTFSGGILRYAYDFQTRNDESYFDVQLKHATKIASDIEVHLHYSPEVNGGVGDTAVFDLETAWANLSGAFVSDTLQVKIPMNGKLARRNYLAQMGNLIGSSAGISDIIACRLTRRQDLGSDTYDSSNNYVFVFTVDFHYEIDALGSNSETSKDTN